MQAPIFIILKIPARYISSSLWCRKFIIQASVIKSFYKGSKITNRVVSRANYFWKTGRYPKSKVPKWGHAKKIKITKQLLKI